jgi:hypothetical protein
MPPGVQSTWAFEAEVGAFEAYLLKQESWAQA